MIPVKPFDTYKWRWLSVQPTESLLKPPIFLGVLRALEKCEGLPPSDIAVFDALKKVENETQSTETSTYAKPVKLARDRERNLLRNSGQYWRGTGLLLPTAGRIELTSLGHKIADGRITQSEFAAIMVQQTILPNPYTYKEEEIKKWQAAGLEIKPFILILQVLEHLGEISGVKNAYLTPDDLIKVIIPLAGIKMSFQNIAQTLLAIREKKISTIAWPDCAPEANDKRLAREFLLFLSHYGICHYVTKKPSTESRYYLGELFDIDSVSSITSDTIFNGENEADTVIKEIISSPLPTIIERQKTITTILSRTGQPRFRKQILKLSNNQCLLTGERISEVLEAAHIIPVTSGGTDNQDNGICLRVDIHRLFDSGNIRIQPSGDIMFSDTVKMSGSYRDLPAKIIIPPFVNYANVEWRHKYC